jgi:hypothetical protein
MNHNKKRKDCKDCKHHYIYWYLSRDHDHMCGHPMVTSIRDTWNVNGKITCTAARSLLGIACGPEATYFEPKPTEFENVSLMNTFDYIDWLESQPADKIEEYAKYSTRHIQTKPTGLQSFWSSIISFFQ